MQAVTTQLEVDQLLATPEKENYFHQIAWFYDKTENNLERAKHYYQLCIDHKSQDWKLSTYNLAHILRFTDTERSIQLLDTIEQEDRDAVWLLAQIYRFEDAEKCLHYFHRACYEDENKLRAAKTMYELANHYRHGFTKLGKSAEKAFEWYLKSAEAGFGRAWIQVADCYHRGSGVPVNRLKETEALLRVPESDWDQTTKFNLAFYYYRGRGCIIPDPEKGLRMMRELDQEYGDRDAQYVLGEAAEKEKDLDRARYWYRKSADQNSAPSVKKLWQLAEKSGDYQEAAAHLEHLLKIRADSREHFDEELPSSTLCVNFSTLAVIFEKLRNAQNQVEECELRPPNSHGGQLFQEAESAFYYHAAENDFHQ